MNKISQLLEGMGSTPDQVAKVLRRGSVQGMRDSSSFMNPIVRYLNRNLDLGGEHGNSTEMPARRAKTALRTRRSGGRKSKKP